jgi:hypothetical protein
MLPDLILFPIKNLRPASLRTGVPENRHLRTLSPTNITKYKRGTTQHGNCWQTEKEVLHQKFKTGSFGYLGENVDSATG